MNKVIHLFLVGLILPATLCMKQSQAGKNDWALKQVGQLKVLQFFNNDDYINKAVYFQSELGIFGHLDSKTGEIIKRQHVQKHQKIIDSNERSLIIWTKARQIVIYDKATMHRTTNNYFIDEPYEEINSYIQNQKIQQKVMTYIGKQNVIIAYETLSVSAHKKSPLQIQIPQGCISLKIFISSQKLMALIWNQAEGQVCVNQVVGQGFMQKKCLKIKDMNQFTINKNNKEIYLQNSNEYLHLSISEDSIQFIRLQSLPIQFLTNGVYLNDGRFYNPLTQKHQKLLRIDYNQKDIALSYHITQQKIILSKQSPEKIQNFLNIPLNHRQKYAGKIQRIWSNHISQIQIQIFVLFHDLELVKYEFELTGSLPKIGSEIWNREQSLAYIEKVLFMKYQGYADHLNNQYHMKMDSLEYKDLSLIQKVEIIPVVLALRIRSQITDIIQFFYETLTEIVSLPSSIPQIQNIKNAFKSQMDDITEKRYGLRKYMIVITEKQTIFALDTKTSQILWKQPIKQKRKLIGLIKLKQEYEKEVAIYITYSQGQTYLSQILQSGTIKNIKQFKTQIEPTIHKISAHSIFIRSGKTLLRYDVNQNLVGEQKNYNFYEVYEDSQKIVGWKNVDNQLIQTWEVNIPLNETILQSQATYRGEPQSKIPISNDKRVVFKNVDFSNIAVLTYQKNQTSVGPIKSAKIVLYIINGITGTVQFTEYQNGVHLGLPINLVYDQNNVIVSYFNSRNRVYEIWSIEAYQYPLQNQLLSQQYAPMVNRQDIVFRSKVFGTVLHINSLHVSQSKQALLKRNIIIITQQMKIYLLTRELISTRRPRFAEPEKNQIDSDEVNSKYPAQDYILPINPHQFLTHNNELLNLENVRLSSTDLESTIFIFANGIDSFLIRIAPDKAFDMLIDGFNYIQLVVVLLLVTILAIFFRSKLKQTKLKKPHSE